MIDYLEILGTPICCFSPKVEIGIFHRDLDAPENGIRNTKEKITVGGELNAKSLQWGMNWSDTRGNSFADMLARW